MSKYSSEFKLEVIKYYLENNVGYQTAADHFGIAYSPVLRWVRKYKENGYVGLMKNQGSSYSGNFKQNVVEYMHENHLSCQETAIHFNLAGDYVVSKWERIYYEEGPQGLYIERLRLVHLIQQYRIFQINIYNFPTPVLLKVQV